MQSNNATREESLFPEGGGAFFKIFLGGLMIFFQQGSDVGGMDFLDKDGDRGNSAYSSSCVPVYPMVYKVLSALMRWYIYIKSSSLLFPPVCTLVQIYLCKTVKTSIFCRLADRNHIPHPS